jgi:cellulose synthase/poly-beta-1,6-N-acetylglucosamine synthase-like glycosyltransferase
MENEILLTRVAAGVSTFALAIGLVALLWNLEPAFNGLFLQELMLTLIFCGAVLCLFYGNIVYQITRVGHIRRHSAHGEDISDGDALYRAGQPRISILIPSYKEQIPVIMQTVLSAALSEHPNRRITLLLDDPPTGKAADLIALNAARALIAELDDLFRRAAQRSRVAADEHNARLASNSSFVQEERVILSGLYEEAADFICRLGQLHAERSQQVFAHADVVFTREVIGHLDTEYRRHAAALRNRADLDATLIRLEYRRLANLFDLPIDCFERKRFRNLSHAPNKAMNLNSYMGLIGRAFRVSNGSDGMSLLEDCPERDADIIVPPVDYIITIDADSIILPDYIGKLVSIMQADPAIAIAQTPYSAYPNPPSTLERAAGATTDIQYLVHQGFTAYNATFWVGANAVLRYSALNEIKAMTTERGHAVPVFIQDKTLIEDTGSTIDLVARGWRLHNHPERLAYSATPPDFGALVIQRRRWANGGLIILPSLLALWRDRGSARAGGLETFIRSHYLISPAVASVSLLLLLAIPFGERFSSVWFPIAAAPYYLLYGRDLIRCGYKWSDAVRVYALTLLLVPVNLAGVYRSLEQIITGRKSAFARTPKIDGRTAVPPSHLIFLVGLLTTSLVSAAANLWSGSLLFCGFSAANAGFLVYGFWRMIGWRDALDDIRAGILARRALRDPRHDAKLAEQPSL